MLVWLDPPAKSQATRHLAGTMPTPPPPTPLPRVLGSQCLAGKTGRTGVWVSGAHLQSDQGQRMNERRAYFCICPLHPHPPSQNFELSFELSPSKHKKYHCRETGFGSCNTLLIYSWSPVRFTCLLFFLSLLVARLGISRCWRCCIVADFVDLSAITSIPTPIIAPYSSAQDSIQHKIAQDSYRNSFNLHPAWKKSSTTPTLHLVHSPNSASWLH